MSVYGTVISGNEGFLHFLLKSIMAYILYLCGCGNIDYETLAPGVGRPDITAQRYMGRDYVNVAVEIDLDPSRNDSSKKNKLMLLASRNYRVICIAPYRP